MTSFDQLDTETKTQLEAAAFRRLLKHFDERKDVQNIDVMDLAGFCRNCLSKWVKAAGEEQGVELEYEDVRAYVYGMPYDEWKSKHQTPR